MEIAAGGGNDRSRPQETRAPDRDFDAGEALAALVDHPALDFDGGEPAGQRKQDARNRKDKKHEFFQDFGSHVDGFPFSQSFPMKTGLQPIFTPIHESWQVQMKIAAGRGRSGWVRTGQLS